MNKIIGWVMGFEPTASRATIWRANQLRYTHHIFLLLIQTTNNKTSLKGFEPPTHGLEGRCSIQLSYRLIEQVMGIEPTYSAWKADVLPLNHTCISCCVQKTDKYWSGWQDSNLRPPGPKPGALAKLSHTPLSRYLERPSLDARRIII